MDRRVKSLGKRWTMVFVSLTSLAAVGGDSRLVEAVKKRDSEAVRLLLRQRADVNAREADGATSLAWAAHWDDLDTADLLIRAGADVNAANDYGVTPLSLACTNAAAAMVELLLKSGANPDAAVLSGETALMTAARTGSLAAVRSLLAHGANVNAKEQSQGQTALMWAVAQKHPEVVRALIDSRADVHARSSGGFTPLLFAAQKGDLGSARLLLDAGASVKEATPKDGSALVVAAASGQEAVATFFLDKGADPNAADRNGTTALHYAASNRNLLKLVRALLAHGAVPNPRLARNTNDTEGLNMLGATPFFMAAVSLNADAMRALAQGGADPLLATTQHTTPLMVAAGVGRFEERTIGEYERALEAVKVAVELGADVTAVGENGWTALHGAAYTGADAIIKFLVDKGANMGAIDKFGQTPLSIAAAVITAGLGDYADVRPRKYRTTTVDLLVKLGAPSLEASGVQRLGSLAVRPN